MSSNLQVSIDPNVLKHRNSINEHSLLERYQFEKYKSDNVVKSTTNYLKKNYKPSPDCMKRYLYKRIPFLKWFFTYDIKENLLKDFIGGVTIGIVDIPQGLAHSLVADQPPVSGLYVIFFSSLVYFFFGTSRNVSVGTDNVVSLMIASAVSGYSGRLYPSDEIEVNDPNYISTNIAVAKQTIGITLAFLTGIIQLILAVCHAGAASKFLSDVVVAAFTTGAAYHIVISQINQLLGIKLPPNQSLFKIINYFINLFKSIHMTNLATMTISIISMIILFLVKQFINRRYAHKLIAPIPIELVLIIFGTLFSYLFEFNARWKVSIVGDIPIGFPAPSFPPANLFSILIGDAISIAIVSFAVNLSMAKLYAKQFNYSIEGNQELLAYGIGNIVNSLFKGFPLCVGLSRTVILVGTKSMTLMYTVFATVILLVVILAVGFLLSTLPHCILAAIIVIALVWMLLEVKQVVPIYKRSKMEALAWIATFAGVIILDIDYGLYIGLGASILLVILQTQRATVTVLGNIPHTDIYECVRTCRDAREIEGIRIIRFEASLYYANVENFNYKIGKLSGVRPEDITPAIKKAKHQFEENSKKIKARHEKLAKQAKKHALKTISQGGADLASTSAETETNLESEERQNELAYQIALESIYSSLKVKDIILDCSSINQLDSMGVDAIAKLKKRYEEVGVSIHLSCCKRSMMRVFGKLNFKDKFDYAQIYPTTHDAVMRILGNRKKMLGDTKTDDVVISFMTHGDNHGYDSDNEDYTEKIDVSQMYVEKPKEFDALEEITKHVVTGHTDHHTDDQVTMI